MTAHFQFILFRPPIIPAIERPGRDGREDGKGAIKIAKRQFQHNIARGSSVSYRSRARAFGLTM
jgi:hypothetical protein